MVAWILRPGTGSKGVWITARVKGRPFAIESSLATKSRGITRVVAMTSVSTSPSGASTPLRPAQRNALCAEITKIVRPLCGVDRDAAATAAHPARSAAAGPAGVHPETGRRGRVEAVVDSFGS